jgi:hypothetical protein
MLPAPAAVTPGGKALPAFVADQVPWCCAGRREQ